MKNLHFQKQWNKSRFSIVSLPAPGSICVSLSQGRIWYIFPIDRHYELQSKAHLSETQIPMMQIWLSLPVAFSKLKGFRIYICRSSLISGKFTRVLFFLWQNPCTLQNKSRWTSFCGAQTILAMYACQLSKLFLSFPSSIHNFSLFFALERLSTRTCCLSSTGQGIPVIFGNERGTGVACLPNGLTLWSNRRMLS